MDVCFARRQKTGEEEEEEDDLGSPSSSSSSSSEFAGGDSDDAESTAGEDPYEMSSLAAELPFKWLFSLLSFSHGSFFCSFLLPASLSLSLYLHHSSFYCRLKVLSKLLLTFFSPIHLVPYNRSPTHPLYHCFSSFQNLSPSLSIYHHFLRFRHLLWSISFSLSRTFFFSVFIIHPILPTIYPFPSGFVIYLDLFPLDSTHLSPVSSSTLSSVPSSLFCLHSVSQAIFFFRSHGQR